MKRSTERKNDQKLDTLGELLFAAPPVKAWVKEARVRLASGEDEASVRTWILEQLCAEGLTLSRTIFPSINRKARRLSLLRTAVALANHYSEQHNLRTLGDAVDRFTEAVGTDAWLADAVVQMARTGEAPRFFDLVAGRVWVQGEGHEDGETFVYAVATNMSHPRELADEFYAECQRVFADSPQTWSKRAHNSEAARYWRLSFDMDDEQIARQELGEPEVKRLIKAYGTAYAQETVNRHAGRIRKARERFQLHVDSWCDEVSD